MIFVPLYFIISLTAIIKIDSSQFDVRHLKTFDVLSSVPACCRGGVFEFNPNCVILETLNMVPTTDILKERAGGMPWPKKSAKHYLAQLEL